MRYNKDKELWSRKFEIQIYIKDTPFLVVLFFNTQNVLFWNLPDPYCPKTIFPGSDRTRKIAF